MNSNLHQVSEPGIKLAPFLFCLLAAGCATPYGPQSFAGGFSETQLGPNIFEVSFRGNGYTGSEQTRDFVLLRSAELALENGYRYFAIVQSGRDATTSYYRTPTYSDTSASVYGMGNYAYGTAQTTTYGGQVIPIVKPSATNTILCFHEKKDDGVVFDAKFLSRSIRNKWGLEARYFGSNDETEGTNQRADSANRLPTSERYKECVRNAGLTINPGPVMAACKGLTEEKKEP